MAGLSLEKQFYKISEVADLVEVPASTLRFWETQFPELKPRRNAHGIRTYTPRDIEMLRLVRYLVRDKGLKIDAAIEQLRHNRTNVSRRYEVVQRLTDIRGRLNELLRALNSRHARK